MLLHERNGIEIELKFLLKEETPEGFAKKFKNILGGTKRVYQKTVMFDNEQGLMQVTNGRIRLRQTDGRVTLSYKRPIPNGNIKKEIEWEVDVGDWRSMENILTALGFKETTSYEKYRSTYQYNNVKIEMDEYPFANFVEIEGKEDKIKETAQMLGFDLRDNLVDSCDTLFTKWRLQKQLPIKLHMRFDDYDK